MGTFKFELDIPEFKDSLELTVMIKRDGDQIVAVPTTKVDKSSRPFPEMDCGGTLAESSPLWKQNIFIPSSNSGSTSSYGSGNMMNINMDEF